RGAEATKQSGLPCKRPWIASLRSADAARYASCLKYRILASRLLVCISATPPSRMGYSVPLTIHTPSLRVAPNSIAPSLLVSPNILISRISAIFSAVSASGTKPSGGSYSKLVIPLFDGPTSMSVAASKRRAKRLAIMCAVLVLLVLRVSLVGIVGIPLRWRDSRLLIRIEFRIRNESTAGNRVDSLGNPLIDGISWCKLQDFTNALIVRARQIARTLILISVDRFVQHRKLCVAIDRMSVIGAHIELSFGNVSWRRVAGAAISIRNVWIALRVGQTVSVGERPVRILINSTRIFEMG